MKINVGKMPCPNEHCASHDEGRPVLVKLEDQTGVLSYNCDVCTSNQYAKLDTPLREDWIREHCQGKEDLIRSAERNKKGTGVHTVGQHSAPAEPQRRGLTRPA